MRLINTNSLKLGRDYIDADSIPPYAVLSHKWGQDEVSFKQMRRLEGNAEARDNSQVSLCQTDGYRKIRKFCEIARERGLLWAWVDTCCIDKSSSAELSEAIHSMARWYERADVCIVYLGDVIWSDPTSEDGDVFAQLENSKWFTRGWTLQELLMPRRLIFYSASWTRIGSIDKDDHLIGSSGTAPSNLLPRRRGFLSSLERASRIRIDDLCVIKQFQTASVAQRMFWASHRETTREEDQSYSLFSLFEVTMAPRYGEGHRAFSRLQRVILQSTSDESLFAWINESPQNGHVLATSPASYRHSNDIQRTPLNLDRALVQNVNGIDIYRDAKELCVFRRERGRANEELLFVLSLGCERSIPGSLEDPCVISLLATIGSCSFASVTDDDTSARRPITIERRMIGDSLSAVDETRLAAQGFKRLRHSSKGVYHFWLPNENIRFCKVERSVLGRRQRPSRL